MTYDRSVVFSGVLHQLNWLQRYNWNIVGSGVIHHTFKPPNVSNRSEKPLPRRPLTSIYFIYMSYSVAFFSTLIRSKYMWLGIKQQTINYYGTSLYTYITPFEYAGTNISIWPSPSISPDVIPPMVPLVSSNIFVDWYDQSEAFLETGLKIYAWLSSSPDNKINGFLKKKK